MPNHPRWSIQISASVESSWGFILGPSPTKLHTVTGTQAQRITSSHRHGTQEHTDTGVPIQRGSLHTQTLRDAPATPNTATRAPCTGSRAWVLTLGHPWYTVRHHETQAPPPPNSTQPHRRGEKCMAHTHSDTLRHMVRHTHLAMLGNIWLSHLEESLPLASSGWKPRRRPAPAGHRSDPNHK